MKPISNLIPLDKAMEILYKNVKFINEIETVNVSEATGRVSGEDVISSMNVPPFARSGMDGYAVISEDTFGAGQHKPRKLSCLEKIHAGEVPSHNVKKGYCSQIATGAMVPEGADGVVKVEDTELEGEQVLIYKPVYPGAHIAPAGEDLKPGDRILKRGDFLSPAKIGVIAALGLDEIKVFRKPEAVILPTGNEVKQSGTKLSPGQIYDVNSHTLSSILSLHGVNPVVHKEIIEDNREKVEDAIKEYRDADIILFSGGSSVGERDVIINAIENLGEVLFHGIAVKPGKPTLFGKVGNSLVFGMPGNPTSCLSNSYIMLIPLVRKMAGLPEDVLRKRKVPLSKRITSELGRHQFLTVKIEDGQAVPVFKSSGAITSMSLADGYIEIPVLVDLIEKGDEVEVTLF